MTNILTQSPGMHSGLLRVPSPGELDMQHPLTLAAQLSVDQTRSEVRDIMAGRDPRMIAVVGPCSMDDTQIGGEYSPLVFAQRLKEIAPTVGGSVLTILRCPPPKPRTNLGRRGLEQKSIATAHEIATQIANESVPLASEVMNPAHMARYGSRLSLAWVGARNVEGTELRHLLSAYPELPVFCKNTGTGDAEPAMNAMKTIGNSHANVEVMLPDGTMGILPESPGNPNTAVLWRGGTDFETPESYEDGLCALSKEDLVFGVDVSHGSAVAYAGEKGAIGQQACLDHLVGLMMNGRLERHPRMVMIEAYLQEGSDTSGNTPGKSLTDPCVSVGQLEDMLGKLARAHEATMAQ